MLCPLREKTICEPTHVQPVKLPDENLAVTYLLSERLQLLRRVFAEVVLLVVHADDASVHREQWPLQPLGHRAVKVLAFILGHVKDDLCGIYYVSLLQ